MIPIIIPLGTGLVAGNAKENGGGGHCAGKADNSVCLHTSQGCWEGSMRTWGKRAWSAIWHCEQRKDIRAVSSGGALSGLFPFPVRVEIRDNLQIRDNPCVLNNPHMYSLTKQAAQRWNVSRTGYFCGLMTSSRVPISTAFLRRWLTHLRMTLAAVVPDKTSSPHHTKADASLYHRSKKPLSESHPHPCTLTYKSHWPKLDSRSLPKPLNEKSKLL